MRNLVLTLVVAVIVIINLSFYNSSPTVLTFENGEFVLQEEFQEIEISELPTAVTIAVYPGFSDETITKAYVNNTQEYKLELIMNGAIETIYTDGYGHWIKN